MWRGVPPPGTERVPPASGAWNLNHWASREVPMKICRAMRKLCTHSGHSIHQPFPSVLLEGQNRTRVIIRKMYWDVWPVTICVYKILWSRVNLWVGLQTPSSEAHLPPWKGFTDTGKARAWGICDLGQPWDKVGLGYQWRFFLLGVSGSWLPLWRKCHDKEQRLFTKYSLK